MKIKFTAVTAALCMASQCLCGCGGTDKSVQADIANLREHYTEIKGDGSDTATVMIYMIGDALREGGIKFDMGVP